MSPERRQPRDFVLRRVMMLAVISTPLKQYHAHAQRLFAINKHFGMPKCGVFTQGSRLIGKQCGVDRSPFQPRLDTRLIFHLGHPIPMHTVLVRSKVYVHEAVWLLPTWHISASPTIS